MEKPMRLHMEPSRGHAGTRWRPAVMKDELSHALFEALYELEQLPADNEDAAMIGLYAVMDDLRHAITRTEALDPPGRQH